MTERARRAGYASEIRLDIQLEAALDAEAERLDAISNPVTVVQEVTEMFIGLEDALQRVGERRLNAIAELYVEHGSYGRIAEITGLSKARVAQLYRQARQRGLLPASSVASLPSGGGSVTI